MDRLPQTPTELLLSFRTREPTSPRLTWYGGNSERVEFSGRVLENWVAKTANYLVDELDAESGTLVALDLPPHWRSLVWLLGTWAVGATAVTTQWPGAASDAGAPAKASAAGSFPHIVATADPSATQQRLATAQPAPLVVAVALPALAMRWPGELPPRVLDYAGEVRAHADVFVADAQPDPGDVAWQRGDASVSYAELLRGAEAAPAPQRVLLEARNGWADVVHVALQTWAAGGSVVLLEDGVAPSGHLRSTENVTAG